MSHPHGTIPDPRLIIHQMEIPGQPGVFVLGCYEHNVSILSQQIRAINLILSLEVEGRLEKYENNPTSGRKSAIVIGSGVAGKTAAAILHRCHCQVTIVGEYETEGANPAATSQRFIHPFISEFPYSTSTNKQPNDADLPVMNWQSNTAENVYKSLDQNWEQILNNDKRHSCDKDIVKETGSIIKILSGVSGYHAITHDGRVLIGDLVILAVGKGRLPSDNNYWSKGVMEKQARASNENGGWILAGMGDSNIAEFITLVFQQQNGDSAYQRLIENAAKQIISHQNTNFRKLLSDCRAIERKCQHLRPGEASRRLEEEYKVLVSEHTDVLDSITEALPLKKKMPKIQIVGALPTLYSPMAFPLNRLVLALAIKCLKHHFTNGDIKYKIGRAILETSKNPGAHENMTQSNTQHQVVRIENGEENDVMVCQHYNERGLPPSPLKSIELNGKSVDDWARSDLHSKNSLDQTRHRMWPYFGNIKRLQNFRDYSNETEAECASHERGHATAEDEEYNTDVNNGFSLIRKVVFRSADRGEIKLEMCYVPGFTVNAERSSGSSLGQTAIEGDPMRVEGFWISRYPITVEEYTRRSDADSTCNPNFPQTNVSWIDAIQFCNAFGLSLPTELQWRASWQWPMEKEQLRHFPWGNNGWNEKPVTEQNAESVFKYCNAFDKGTDPAHGSRYGVCDVKCYAHASSPWGTVQQFGNVLEWCVWDGRAMSHYWPTSTTDHGDQYNDPRFRPIGGLSALDLDFDSAVKTWMEFGTAHHATRRPDLGFRVVWIPPTASALRNLAKAWDNTKQRELTNGNLPTSTMWWQHIVEKLRERRGKSGYTYKDFVTEISNKTISTIEIVFGDWNSTKHRGLKSSGALASDAIGVDIFIRNLLMLQPGLEFSFYRTENFKNEAIVQPAANTARVFIGSGAVNRGTAIALREARNLCLVADVTFDGPEAIRIWDHKNSTFSGSDGLVTIQRLSKDSKAVGPVIISAGIGRQGTILATKSLADIVRAGVVSDHLLGLEAIFVYSERSTNKDSKNSPEYELRAQIGNGVSS